MLDAQKAYRIYESIRENLAGHDGEFIAIELGSQEYFLGKTAIEAYHKGPTKYPGKQFFFLKVGRQFTYFIGGARSWKRDSFLVCPS